MCACVCCSRGFVRRRSDDEGKAGNESPLQREVVQAAGRRDRSKEKKTTKSIEKALSFQRPIASRNSVRHGDSYMILPVGISWSRYDAAE